jgi:hypothetical protein
MGRPADGGPQAGAALETISACPHSPRPRGARPDRGRRLRRNRGGSLSNIGLLYAGVHDGGGSVGGITRTGVAEPAVVLAAESATGVLAGDPTSRGGPIPVHRLVRGVDHLRTYRSDPNGVRCPDDQRSCCRRPSHRTCAWPGAPSSRICTIPFPAIDLVRRLVECERGLFGSLGSHHHGVFCPGMCGRLLHVSGTDSSLLRLSRVPRHPSSRGRRRPGGVDLLQPGRQTDDSRRPRRRLLDVLGSPLLVGWHPVGGRVLHSPGLRPPVP